MSIFGINQHLQFLVSTLKMLLIRFKARSGKIKGDVGGVFVLYRE